MCKASTRQRDQRGNCMACGARYGITSIMQGWRSPVVREMVRRQQELIAERKRGVAGVKWGIASGKTFDE